MSESLNEAIKILLVGMTTVFFILTIVVFVGRFLIGILNKTNFILNKKESSNIGIEENLKSAMQRAVYQWSEGKARITEIRKSNSGGKGD